MSGGGPFRSRSARLLHDLHHGPNMTPMVDVVMVILIFFMASTTLLGPEVLLRARVAEAAREPGASATADAAAGADAIELPPPTFALRLRLVNGVVLVDGLGLAGAPPEALGDAAMGVASRLGEGAARTSRVVIEPDDGISYELVVRATEACRAAGFEQVAVR